MQSPYYQQGYGYPTGQSYPPPYDAATAKLAALQISEKPSAHIEGTHHSSITLTANRVINQWSQNAPHGHVAGGMVYDNGKLRVPVAGMYYIYCQIYFNPSDKRSRFLVMRNGTDNILLGHATSGNRTEGVVYAGAVFRLHQGDEIHVQLSDTHNVWMGPAHCYFGAHMI